MKRLLYIICACVLTISGLQAQNEAPKQLPTKTAGVVADQISPPPNHSAGTSEWVYSDVQIKSIKAPDPTIDPKALQAPIWDKAPATTIPVMAQNMVYPSLQNASLTELTVKSLYGEKQVAFLIQWKDESKNSDVDVDRFCDQLAIQMPVDAQGDIPSFMMGNKDGRVHIVHWKAVWQQDCDSGFTDVQDRYPNTWVDVYPGQEATIDRSKRVYAKDITAEQIVESQSYNSMPGTYSKNPMSAIKRKEPVEEANAEGFGTLATQQTQAARGWAVWNNGKWSVCVIIPVNTGNIYKAKFQDKTKVSFAVWDGGKENIGGRKHYAQWADLLLQP